jgi:hypothetical protein
LPEPDGYMKFACVDKKLTFCKDDCKNFYRIR